MNKIKKFIFDKPEKWVHLREIARRLKVSPNSVKKYAEELKMKKIIEEKKEGNMIMLRGNMESEAYLNEKRIYNLKSILDSPLIGFLEKFYQPNAIILFGSYSRGEDVSSSDIDLAIETSIKKHPNLEKFETQLSRKIELSLFTKNQISNEFFNNLINGIVIKGVIKNA